MEAWEEKYVKLKKFQLLFSNAVSFLMNGGMVRPPGGKQQTSNLYNFQATINVQRIRELWELSKAGSFSHPGGCYAATAGRQQPAKFGISHSTGATQNN